MEFKGIEKIHAGRYITRYNVKYTLDDGAERTYEMVSRDKYLSTLADLNRSSVQAVVMIMHDRSGERILLCREFRMAVGEWVYNFPAGLIEPGESIESAARRELKEETGLDLVEVKRRFIPCYSAVGFSNEKNICIIGVADGSFSPSTSPSEEISAAWYTREEVEKLIDDARFAARTQAYCHLWSLQGRDALGKG